MKDLTPVKEFAKMLNVRPITLRRWCLKGVFKTVTIGKLVFIPRPEIERLWRLALKPKKNKMPKQFKRYHDSMSDEWKKKRNS